MITKIKDKLELRTRKGVSLATILLLGVEYPGDGNGGIFFWDNNSTLLDDEDSVFKVNTVSQGRWIRATSGVVVGGGNIENITNIISNDQTFINNIVNNITGGVISELNVEIQDINGKTLFFAFMPGEIPTITDEIKDDIIDDQGNNSSCQLPTSFSIDGNLHPFINTTETYTINNIGGQDLFYVWSVSGGTVIGSNIEQSVTIEWGDSLNLCSLTGAVFCLDSQILYNFNFFILERESDNLQVDPLCNCKIFNIENGSEDAIGFKYRDCTTGELLAGNLAIGESTQGCVSSPSQFLSEYTNQSLSSIAGITITDTLLKCC